MPVTEVQKKAQEKYQQSDKGKAARRRYRQSDKSKITSKKGMRKYNYGITEPEYYQLLKEQGGVCAICGNLKTKERNGKTVALSVDHNHKTGKIRGLLCSKCNFVLGNSNEDMNILANSITYLFKHLI